MNIIDKYIDCANFICLSQMYLKKINIRTLSFSLKKYNPGHWGCSPSINTLIANLSYYSKKNNLNTQLIIGTGHAGSALSANIFMQEKFKNIKFNQKNLNKIIDNYGTILRTEINPFYPNTIYDGGELGYSLAFSYGVAINNDCFIPCIIGDGEAETSTFWAALQLNKTLNRKGFVLPIINLNGLKMESKTYLSSLTNNELKRLFNSFGYKVYICNKNNILKTLNKLSKKKKPLIVYKSIKGDTLPIYNNECISGTIKSHKNPLQDLNDLEKHKYIKKWIKNYNLDLFYNKSILNNFKYTNYTFKDQSLKLPNINKYLTSNKVDNITLVDKYISDIIDKNNNFLLTSPDELKSNKFYKTSTKRHFELLNEHLCQLLIQGHILGGNPGLIISYEAFMPVATSIISQYAKYIYQLKKADKNRKVNSLNYILTSTCFENNFSHQNPEFVSNLINKEWSFINCYYPKDPNNALACLDEALKSNTKINIITSSKGTFPIYNNINTKIEVIKDCLNPKGIIICSGDYILKEVFKIQNLDDIKIIYVTNISILKDEKLLSEYLNCNNITYFFQGYASVIKNLLYNYNGNIKVYGYKDKSDISGNTEKKLKANNLDNKSMLDIINRRKYE